MVGHRTTRRACYRAQVESVDVAEFEDVERPIDAVCGRHPERRASIVCPYCGSFACGDCTVDTLWGDVMCDECQQHGRAQYPLPWEESLSPVAFVHTAYLVFADVVSLFGALPAGRVRRAFGFATCVALLTALASALTQWLFASRHWAARAPSLSDALLRGTARDLVASALFILLVTGVFHAVASLLGGRASLNVAVRGVCYLTAADLLGTTGAVADTIVGGNTFSVLLGLCALFLVGFGLTMLAEQRYGLPRGRAVTAGSAPVALLILLVIAVTAASAMLAARGL
jgi:hypothetical protein